MTEVLSGMEEPDEQVAQPWSAARWPQFAHFL